MASPKLRFKEFDSEWTLQNLGSLFSKRRDKGISGVPTYSVTLNNGIVNRDDLERDTPTNLSPQEHLLVKKNDLVYNMMRMWQGALGLAPTDGIVSPAYVVLKPSEQKTNSNFFEYYFKKNRQIHNFWAYSQGLTEDRLRLYFDDFKVIKINAPSKEEQTKIASFLSAVDEKIAQLTQKHELLSQYKQGMIQKLFSQQIRFKADDGSEFEEWKEKPLNYYLYTSKLKNKDLKYSKCEVLSVSGDLGVVNQIELLGRSYAGVSVAPYGVVEHGDIVYTKSPLKSNPYGIIKVNKGKSGIVSTLYAIYKCRNNIIPNLIDYYFQNHMKLNHFLKPLVKKGAKNDMKVNNDHVLTGLVIFPSSIEEQVKIVKFLSIIDQKIEIVAKQIEQAKQWKKGLSQQMFV